MSDRTTKLIKPGRRESLGSAVCAIGAFDGVHAGHRFLIEQMMRDAEARGVASVIVTFDRDPDELFRKPEQIRKILSNDDRITLLSRLGADYLYVLPFTHEFAEHTFQSFLAEYIISVMDLECIHVGCDFQLGAGAGGDVGKLKLWGLAHGCDCIGYDLEVLEGEVVTATRIRDLIGHGDVEMAAELLGREHFVRGTVVHGRGEGGARFNIPTANVDISIPYTPLLEGVYAGYVGFDGTDLPAAINVGRPPTFEDATCTLEPHILDFDGDLYGREVTVTFSKRLRDLIVFHSDEELEKTIGANIEWVRTHLHARACII